MRHGNTHPVDHKISHAGNNERRPTTLTVSQQRIFEVNGSRGFRFSDPVDPQKYDAPIDYCWECDVMGDFFKFGQILKY